MTSLERFVPSPLPPANLSIQILARSYAVRYRECSTNETLVWQFKPIKKSINWGIWLKSSSLPDEPARVNISRRGSTQRGSVAETEDERRVNLQEKLTRVGMLQVVPGGRCEGGQILKGSYTVMKSGMYALVFDNTFSKNTSKTVFFIFASCPATVLGTVGEVGSSLALAAITDDTVANTFSGVLHKKRRKKMQGTLCLVAY
jgi:oxysterol-binding protein-related protein 3/6/7